MDNAGVHAVLGIGGSLHDFAACLVVDGTVVSAIEEERLSRVKYHPIGRISPEQLRLRSVDYCLAEAGLQLEQLDAIVANDIVFAAALRGLDVQLINHHLAHAAAVYYQSGFPDSAVLVSDGYGSMRDGFAEHCSSFRAAGSSISRVHQDVGRIQPIDSGRPVTWDNIDFVEDSLGEFYSFITNEIGFGAYEEGKTMGLAAYGQPRFFEDMCQTLLLQADGRISFAREQHEALREELSSSLCGGIQTNFQGCADVASSAQQFLEQALLARLTQVANHTESRNVCLSGGIFMNCVANDVLLRSKAFDHYFVHGAASDNGTAIGAAMYGFASLQERTKTEARPVLYGGRTYHDDKIVSALVATSDIQWQRSARIEREAAVALAEGSVVAWFQGGSEFGARALGNRSILADPRSPGMQSHINSLIKGREWFRPFAPSVIAERAEQFFSMPAPASPFMCVNARVISDSPMPAITHVDGSARVQTVSRADNPRFYELIKEFELLTGIPVVLNTSFNEHEPIVETPGDALRCFLRTKLDILCLGDYLVRRL